MFSKYASIENTYRDEYLQRLKDHGFYDETFVVQEKAHGANLSFWTTDGVNFVSAKRTATLEADEKFYNHQAILDSLKPKLINIWQALKDEMPELERLAFFGEVIGGSYPHKAVQIDKTAIKVQKGIFYSPHNVFYAFDIKVNDTYLNIHRANELFVQENMLHAKTLLEGNLQTCLEYPNEFDSVIAGQLGLPVIENNIVEGVVIKPVKPLYTNNSARVILKNKNAIWAERAKKRNRISKQEKYSDKVRSLQAEILTYVTKNRLNNVISKIGEVTQKDFGMVIAEFSKDVIADFSKDYAHELKDMDKKEVKDVTKSFMKKAQGLVRERLVPKS